MSLHRTKATMIGLFEAGRVNEWVVTEKLGAKAGGKPTKKWRINVFERVHLLELGVGGYLLICAAFDAAFGKNGYFICLFIQAMAFFIAGFGYVGTFVPAY